ncbi:MAG TPA: alkaline phosphatase D family protein [Polyangiaceae bacterium]
MSQLPRRRDLLKMSLVAVSALPGACYRSGGDSSALPEAESVAFFPQSVASGDPRPDGVVLWVRAYDDSRPTENLSLTLQLWLDAEQTQAVQLEEAASKVVALAEADHCVRVRVSKLEPATTYYYRFRYLSPIGWAETRLARTRTAPAKDDDVSIKLGVVCCQDYGGKYFHVHRHLSQQELDFVLHLGDYVYESTGDSSFQTPTEARQVTFSAPKEALEVRSGERHFLAASSLSNYRDLYKLYRSDRDLQALHERHPIIAIWDDHEFSDDCHGDVATYEDGRRDETSAERRAAADQAWFEYMPIDYETAPAARFDASDHFPDNFGIYRSFEFGRHLQLVVTDLRRFRPDHLVPEDAPPGVVFLTQEQLQEQADALPDDAVPYVDVDSYADGVYAEALRAGAEALDISAEKVTGQLSAVWINQALVALELAEPVAIELDDPALERGYAYHCLLKTSEFSRIGSRYMVALQPFEALAKRRFEESGGQSENLMGDAQRAWFLETLAESSSTFKLWGSEVAFMSRHIDLTGVSLAPPELQRAITISAEDWDGFPNERRALLSELSKLGNVLILSGDLHCFFAGTPALQGDPEASVIELTTGSVSSTTWLDGMSAVLSSGGSIPMEVETLVQSVGTLLADSERRPNPHLAYQELARHGYSLVEVGADAVTMSVKTIASEQVATPPQQLSGELGDLFETVVFRARADRKQLERQFDGAFLTWDMEEMAYK